MGEPVRIIANVPNHGSRDKVTLFRKTRNFIQVRVLDENDNDVDVVGWAFKVAGKRHESDASSLFDVSGTVSGVSGLVDFTIPIASAVDTFDQGGLLEFRWFKDGITAQTPDGRKRNPLVVAKEIES